MKIGPVDSEIIWLELKKEEIAEGKIYRPVGKFAEQFCSHGDYIKSYQRYDRSPPNGAWLGSRDRFFHALALKCDAIIVSFVSIFVVFLLCTPRLVTRLRSHAVGVVIWCLSRLSYSQVTVVVVNYLLISSSPPAAAAAAAACSHH